MHDGSRLCAADLNEQRPELNRQVGARYIARQSSWRTTCTGIFARFTLDNRSIYRAASTNNLVTDGCISRCSIDLLVKTRTSDTEEQHD